MTTIDYAHLRTLAEKATPDGEHGTYTFEGTRRLREFQHEVSPQTVLALLDEIERLRGEVEWEYVWSGEDRFRRRPAGAWERVEGEGDA